MDRHLEELREKLFSSELKCVKVDCFAFNDTYKNYCAMGGCIQLFLDTINIRIKSEKLKSKYEKLAEPKFSVGETFYQPTIYCFEDFLKFLEKESFEENMIVDELVVSEIRFSGFDKFPQYFSVEKNSLSRSVHNEYEMYKTKEEVIKKTLDMLFTKSRDRINKLEKETVESIKARDLILELEEKFLNGGK